MSDIVTTVLVSAGTAFSTRAIEGPIQTFNDIWNGVFGHKIHYWAEKKRKEAEYNFECYVSLIDKKVSNIPEEDLQEPKLSIIRPALEASNSYIEEIEIREMFANLIAASMDKTYNGLVQHSFVEIIKQLSSHDAKLFNNFDTSEPVVSLVNFTNKEGDYNTEIEKLYLSSDFQNYNLNEISLDNLIRLGLIEIHDSKYLSEDSLYERYSNFGKVCIGFELDETDSKVCLKRILQVTAFGKAFKEVCLRDVSY